MDLVISKSERKNIFIKLKLTGRTSEIKKFALPVLRLPYYFGFLIKDKKQRGLFIFNNLFIAFFSNTFHGFQVQMPETDRDNRDTNYPSYQMSPN